MRLHIGTRFWFLKLTCYLRKHLTSSHPHALWCNILLSSYADFFLLPCPYRGDTGSNCRRFCDDLTRWGESAVSEYSHGVLIGFCQCLNILWFYPCICYICFISQIKYVCLVYKVGYHATQDHKMQIVCSRPKQIRLLGLYAWLSCYTGSQNTNCL